MDADLIADRLATERWLLIPDWLTAAHQSELLAVARERAQGGQLKPAKVGQAGLAILDNDVRGDSIEWLEHSDADPCVPLLLRRLDELRQALNERLYLGLVETEAHFAHYPPGARYQRHLDRFRSDDARTLSAVIHLGQPWTGADGGELRLYLQDPNGERSLDLPPIPGQLVLFLSGEIEHEVLPTRRDRYSVAGWMRRRASAGRPAL